MTKSHLITIVAKRAHLTKKASKEAIEVFLDEVKKALKKGEKVFFQNWSKKMGENIFL